MRATRSAALPWERPGWLESARLWVYDHVRAAGLAPTGPLRLVRTRPWAAIANVRTDQGQLWFKETAPALAFEGPLTLFMARRRPDLAPEVVATEDARILTFDAGVELRSFSKKDQKVRWGRLLPRYAEVQIALIGDVRQLTELGTPNQQPDRLLAAYPRLRGLPSLVGELARGIPPTLIHREVTAGNVLIDKSGHTRVLDWAEAAISHPFAGLVNTFRDIAWSRRLQPNGREIIRLRAAYLEPWTPFASTGELEHLFERGYLFGMLCLAASWQRIMAARPDDAKFGRHADIWMQFFRDAATHGVEIGGPV